MTTWSVFERTLRMSHGGTTVRENQVAICATRDQALDEFRRLSDCNCQDSYCGRSGAPEWESPTYYIKEGAITIGLTLVP